MQPQQFVYVPLEIKRDIRITRLHSVHYYEFAAGYLFPGERHNFWELVYLDSGEAEIGADERLHVLRQGDILFHQPNEFHTIWANRPTGPNIVVVSFASSSPAMRRFRNARFVLDAQERRLLQQLVAEARGLFGPLLDYHCDLNAVLREDAPAGAAQMIVTYLELLLLRLLRREAQPNAEAAPAAPRVTAELRAAQITQQLQQYMREHLADDLKFPDFCRFCGMSGTTLKELFHRYNGMGVVQCYQQLRIEEARRLLREGRLNVSEVAAALGYSSCQHFSAQFKRLLGVSPTNYLRLVK